ncbi:MAG: DUF1223 domain-containing protein, partial [Verrucomicrobia bacterium]|nr:DUF1223 domain-containing protein [Verrucomicrobiota bacterium]
MNMRGVSIFLIVAYLVSGARGGAVFESGPDKVVLVELFTSEGCSSCPPAEAWLNHLTNDARLWRKVVPVSFHVDYWDSLGWKDPLAKKQFTIRQQQYAEAWRISSVYTPGFAINGEEWKGWFDGESLP